MGLALGLAAATASSCRFLLLAGEATGPGDAGGVSSVFDGSAAAGSSSPALAASLGMLTSSDASSDLSFEVSLAGALLLSASADTSSAFSSATFSTPSVASSITSAASAASSVELSAGASVVVSMLSCGCSRA